ncbi:hypothetical protein AMS68_004765 [Peltaster fructicola]|uniref:O-methyltransferase domain-containing protein n=1 Tax=Peltaster fructicola TaxID=286661 RepID=A0A6H0XXC3_9PEZI|nr:hypothetical protein AMS68_004765 [Peltaster fructicola]
MSAQAWAELDVHLFEINDAGRKLAQTAHTYVSGSEATNNGRSDSFNGTDGDAVTPQPLVPASAPQEVHSARQSLLVHAAMVQNKLRDPSDFLRQLMIQSQLLACLHWLAYNQILACIPLNNNVLFIDVAALAGVPVTELTRIIRMTATIGFLCEPEPGYAAHSPLSAEFVQKPSLVDVIMFTAEISAPSALAMKSTTTTYNDSPLHNETAYNVAFETNESFASVLEKKGKVQRQYLALERHIALAGDEHIASLLSTLSWVSLGDVTVVEVGAGSTTTATALSKLAPNLSFIVQLRQDPQTQYTPAGSSNSSVSGSTTGSVSSSFLYALFGTEYRAPGTAQTHMRAAVYIFHLPPMSALSPGERPVSRIITELKAHFCMLRKNPTAMLIIVGRLLPEPGSVDPDIEAVARGRDLAMKQLSNLRELEVKEMADLVAGIQDKFGRLLIVNKLVERRNPVVALEIRYQTYPQHSINGAGQPFC